MTIAKSEEVDVVLFEIGRQDAIGEIERDIPLLERLYNTSAVRKTLVVVALAVIWEVYARYLDNPFLLPTLSATLRAWVDACRDGTLFSYTAASLKTLMLGYAVGLLIAGALTVFAIGSRIGNDLLETMTAMFNPLPAIALLPLALIWFGIGNMSLVFVLVHSVVWAVALNTLSGFQSVPKNLRIVGQNYGLNGVGLVLKVLIPAAFPSILSGLKIGWAFSWRTLIAAELVFGVSSGGGGLGWFIFESKNQLDIPKVFAGLLTIIMIGLIVENIVFRQVQQRTVVRWGMQL